MQTLSGITVMAIDTKPRLGIRKKVAERLASGKCLNCEEPAEKLGCCGKHYHQFRTELLKRPIEEREIFKARQIRAGKIASSRQGQRTDLTDNVFAETPGA